MAKVVIDANVIISAAFGGKPLEAIVRAIEEHEVYLSRDITQELQGVILKLSKKLSGEQIAFIQEKMEQIVDMAKHVTVSIHLALSRDAKDDHYLSLCKEIDADFLITGDKDLLNISEALLKKNGISCQIITPQAFLNIVF